jgi:hypothetical protein
MNREAEHQQPSGDPHIGADRKYRTWFRFRPRFRVMPAEPKPPRALKTDDIPRF